MSVWPDYSSCMLLGLNMILTYYSHLEERMKDRPRLSLGHLKTRDPIQSTQTKQTENKEQTTQLAHLFTDISSWPPKKCQTMLSMSAQVNPGHGVEQRAKTINNKHGANMQHSCL